MKEMVRYLLPLKLRLLVAISLASPELAAVLPRLSSIPA
jgi:hypothetical protein